MNIRTTLSRGLAAAFCLAAWLPIRGIAQEEDDKPGMVRFTVWGEWKGKELHVKNPGKSGNDREAYIKLDLLDLGYSAAVPFPRGRPVELFTPVEMDGETVWQPIVSFPVPGEIREPLVMIFSKEDGGVEHKMYDLDPSVFPYGSYLLVNLTTVRLFAKLDETGVLLGPGESAPFKGGGQASINVWLRVAAEGADNNAQPVYSAMMRNRNDKRMFMFFHSDGNTEETPIEVRTLVDFAPAAAPP